MGIAKLPGKVKLFSGIMYSSDSVLAEAVKKMEELFGSIELRSRAFEFDFTDYYTEEMGKNILKIFAVFREPVLMEELPGIKLLTNRIESELSVGGKRRVNIDPGYITAKNVVLATTKDSGHRIYLRDGIFAEVTLSLSKKGCSFFEWTYPDFRTALACNFFMKARGLLP